MVPTKLTEEKQICNNRETIAYKNVRQKAIALIPVTHTTAINSIDAFAKAQLRCFVVYFEKSKIKMWLGKMFNFLDFCYCFCLFLRKQYVEKGILIPSPREANILPQRSNACNVWIATNEKRKQNARRRRRRTEYMTKAHNWAKEKKTHF